MIFTLEKTFFAFEKNNNQLNYIYNLILSTNYPSGIYAPYKRIFCSRVDISAHQMRNPLMTGIKSGLVADLSHGET